MPPPVHPMFTPAPRLTRFAALLLTLLPTLLLAPTTNATASTNNPPTATLDAQAGGVTSYLLPNGFKIILIPYPTAATTRVELLVKSGSKHEGYGETGMAHLLEHMLFKGAGARASLKQDLTAIGANWNGTTSTDQTRYFETMAADPEKIDEAIKIEADRFLRPRFTQADLVTEMPVVRNELEQGDNSPERILSRALFRQSYFWHGYGRPPIGARSDIENAPFTVLQAFHARHYRPDNAALIVSGKFDVPHVLQLASTLFSVGINPATPKPANWTWEESRAVTNRSELYFPAGKTLVASAWKLPGQNDRSTYAMDMAVAAICDPDWGSLRKDIVLTRKLANMASCSTQDNADYSLFIASAAAGKEADADALSKALHAHIEAAAHQGITQAQLDRALQEYQADSERLDNAHESLASALSVSEVHGDWRLLFEERDILKSITVAEANAALKKWVVAINRSDVLMHHADTLVAPVIPQPADGKAMVAGKSWPSVIKTSDPIPTSAREIAHASRVILLDDGQVKAGLISRRTQGDMAWISVHNHYGSADSLKGRTHACSIASGLMHFGGGGLSRDALDAKMTSLKARGSVSLGGFSLEAPRTTLSEALDTLISVWSAPTLPPGEFENLKAATISSIEAALQEPASLASEVVEQRFNNYPPTHPFRHYTPEEGLQTIRAMTYDDAKRCIDDFNGRAHMTIGIVGAFSKDDVEKVWTQITRLPKARVAYARIPAIEPAPQLDVTPVVTSLPNKPNATVFGKTVIPLIQSAEDYAALRLAIEIIGGNSESRIWQQLRENSGLAYSAGASLNGGTFEPRGSITFMASAPSGRSDEALALLQQEIARALKDGFSEQEVTREKLAWAQQRTNNLRAESSYAGMLAKGLFDGYDLKFIADYDARLARTTVAEVNRAFRKYLEAAPIIWAIGRGQ